MKARRSGSRIVLDHESLDYAVVTKGFNKAKQYTMGLLYQASKPGEIIADAHGESISDEELYKARLAYVQSADRSIHLQHGLTDAGLVKVGEWVDLAQWPDPVEAEFMLPNGKTTKATIPANSVWIGIVWNDLGWKLVKSGQLRGLSLGGYRRKKAKETTMAKQEEPILDSIEGYALEGVKKAMPDPWDNPTNTGPANQRLTAPKAPVIPGSNFGPAKPRRPMDGVKVTDHKPRLDKRFREFLRSLEDYMTGDNYRSMLEIIAAFNDRTMSITDQQGHIDNLKQLAASLGKIMPSASDVVQILRMGGFVAAEQLEDLNTWEIKTPVPQGLGDAIAKMARRGLNQHVFSDTFTGEESDPIDLKKTQRKQKKDDDTPPQPGSY